jgi:hypothetical protein
MKASLVFHGDQLTKVLGEEYRMQVLTGACRRQVFREGSLPKYRTWSYSVVGGRLPKKQAIHGGRPFMEVGHS